MKKAEFPITKDMYLSKYTYIVFLGTNFLKYILAGITDFMIICLCHVYLRMERKETYTRRFPLHAFDDDNSVHVNSLNLVVQMDIILNIFSDYVFIKQHFLCIHKNWEWENRAVTYLFRNSSEQSKPVPGNWFSP